MTKDILLIEKLKIKLLKSLKLFNCKVMGDALIIRKRVNRIFSLISTLP